MRRRRHGQTRAGPTTARTSLGVLANPVQGMTTRSKQTSLRTIHPISTALQRVEAVSSIMNDRPTAGFLERGQRTFWEEQDRSEEYAATPTCLPRRMYLHSE